MKANRLLRTREEKQKLVEKLDKKIRR